MPIKVKKGKRTGEKKAANLRLLRSHLGTLSPAPQRQVAILFDRDEECETAANSLHLGEDLLIKNFGYFKALLNPAHRTRTIETSTRTVRLRPEELDPFHVIIAYLTYLSITVDHKLELSIDQCLATIKLADYLQLVKAEGLAYDLQFIIRSRLFECRTRLLAEHVEFALDLPSRTIGNKLLTAFADAAVKPTLMLGRAGNKWDFADENSDNQKLPGWADKEQENSMSYDEILEANKVMDGLVEQEPRFARYILLACKKAIGASHRLKYARLSSIDSWEVRHGVLPDSSFDREKGDSTTDLVVYFDPLMYGDYFLM